MPRISRAVLLVVLALGLVAPGGEARAAENGDFSLRPVRPAGASERDRSYVVKTVAPGTTFEDTLEARNFTDDPLDLVVESVDASVTPDGAFAATSTRSAEGAWITVAPGQVRVPANGGRRVKLTIAVPADATAGDHIAAVVVRRAAAPSGQGTVQVVEQVGVRVYLTVTAANGSQAQATRAFDLKALRWVGTAKKRVFEADVVNTGSLLVEPLGTLTIRRGDLTSTADLPVLGTVPPGRTTTLRIGTEGTLEPGTYQATLALKPVQGGAGDEITTEFTVDAAAADKAEETPAEKERSRRPLIPALLAGLALVVVVAELVRRRFAAAD